MMSRSTRQKPGQDKSFYARKVAKSGAARYIAVSRILPPDWQMVKVSVEKLEGNICILRLERLI